MGTADASGTAGLIVSSDVNGCSRLILSNNHVLADNNTARFSATLQPGGADGGTIAKDRIGQLERVTKLSRKRPNYLDAATAKPLRRSLLKPAYAVFGIVPGHVRCYKVGDRLKKVGRTTGVVNGTVESIHTDVQVDYGDYGNLGTITFKDQSVIRGKRPVSLEGDSGSVWLTRKGNLAAAVNLPDRRTECCPSLIPLNGLCRYSAPAWLNRLKVGCFGPKEAKTANICASGRFPPN
ncbi:hypothetical protein HMSSN139_51050 [Paenibacillus sp. HMSSN-139]|nr:hypothetical protein HMSSN139_51050 [Paenibacillus sp. HMSSN-139]